MTILGVSIAVVLLIVVGFVIYLKYRINNIPDTNNLREIVDKNAQQLIAQQKVVGMAVGIIQGEKMYMQGYGYADIAQKTPVDSSTLFEIASISKVFTTELTEILVQQKQLAWEDKVYQFIPNGYQPNKDDGTTLLHLATHTSGYPRIPKALLDKITNDCNPYATLTETDILNYVKNPQDKRVPEQSTYDYSNFGIGLLGHILEWKTGQTYEQLLEQELLSKLDMKNTGLTVKNSAKFAVSYDSMRKVTCHWDFGVLYGAGAIRSDLTDMMKFAKANLNGKTPYDTLLRSTQKPLYTTITGAAAKGWQIDDQTDLVLGIGKVVWHNGGTGGFSTFIGLIPDRNVGIVILANQADVNKEIEQMAYKLLLKAQKVTLQ